ncbi:hypothetical protein F4859DRAFT_485473 [Xylaria cf. heliscus]|nr:hypothetical protein F4859DRAFT_485473 [Xylaria cf. heliscus]
MRASLALLTAAAAAVTAQNSTSLPELVSELPTCAIPCFNSGAEAANCSTTDFSCLCGDGKTKFISAASTCVLGACKDDDFSNAISLAGQICTVVTTGNPDPSAVASASAIVTSALGAASATSSPDSAAFRPEFGFGLLGAAVAAALAL